MENIEIMSNQNKKFDFFYIVFTHPHDQIPNLSEAQIVLQDVLSDWTTAYLVTLEWGKGRHPHWNVIFKCKTPQINTSYTYKKMFRYYGLLNITGTNKHTLVCRMIQSNKELQQKIRYIFKESPQVHFQNGFFESEIDYKFQRELWEKEQEKVKEVQELATKEVKLPEIISIPNSRIVKVLRDIIEVEGIEITDYGSFVEWMLQLKNKGYDITNITKRPKWVYACVVRNSMADDELRERMINSKD